MLKLAFRLIFKDKGGKQHCLPFVGTNMAVDMFLEKRKRQKRMRWIFCIGVSRKFYAKRVCFSIVFWL